MRLLFINRLMGILWGGGESFDYNMGTHLERMGHDVTILTGKPLQLPPRNNIEDLKTHYLATPYLRSFSYRFSGKIPKIPTAALILDLFIFEMAAFQWIKKHENEFDIIQILSMPRLAKLVVKKIKKPSVVRFPGPPSDRWDIPIIRELKSTPLAEFFSAGDTIQFLKKRGIEVNNIPQGVDSVEFRKRGTGIRDKYKIADCDTVLISCGRLVPGKGFEFLIDAFRFASTKHKNIKLLIVGDGPLKSQLEKKTGSLGLNQSIIFTGRVEHRDLSYYYSAADLFLLLSPYENFSNAVLEAMACELPIIATRAGGFPLQIREGINGFLINNGDIGELVNKIIFLSQSPETRKEIGEANRRMVLNHYNWAIQAKKLINLYDTLLEKK